MPKLIKATYHPKLKVAEFIADNGDHLLRAGGTLPWRINNGGDLVSPTTNGQPSPKKTKDYIGFAPASERHFFIFPDYETGRREMLASLKRQHSGKTIPELTNSYVKEGAEANGQYADKLLNLTKVRNDKKLSEFTEAEMNALADGIEQLEGYHNEKDSRKEVWVKVSRITATDGAYTLPDEEVTLVMDGKETTLKSNAVGQFPPIAHGPSPIEVKHRTPDGNLKSVGTIGGEQGKLYNLISQVKRFMGQTAPDTPTEPKQTKRQPFRYTVQPGDTLAKLAARFETSVEDIKRDNQRTNNKLFAGEVIGIYGPPSGQQMAARPKPTPKRPAAPASAASAAASSTSASAPAVKPAPKKEPPPANQVDAATRSDEGSGKPLAIFEVDSSRAPWMKIAVAEAKRFKGKLETEIEKEQNYATDVRTGQTTIVGDKHPWCAAFVNWCLMTAKYPIENASFNDKTAAKGRAHGFYEVEGEKAKKSDKHGPIVRNPLFVQLEQPIYGAIAVVTNSAGHGHHVGFVYAWHGKGKLAVLGGNQTNTIKFSPYSVEATQIIKKKMVGGKIVEIKKWSDHLMFFVPATYAEQARKDAKDPLLIESTCSALNKGFGIETDGAETDTTL